MMGFYRSVLCRHCARSSPELPPGHGFSSPDVTDEEWSSGVIQRILMVTRLIGKKKIMIGHRPPPFTRTGGAPSLTISQLRKSRHQNTVRVKAGCSWNPQLTSSGSMLVLPLTVLSTLVVPPHKMASSSQKRGPFGPDILTAPNTKDGP